MPSMFLPQGKKPLQMDNPGRLKAVFALKIHKMTSDNAHGAGFQIGVFSTQLNLYSVKKVDIETKNHL